uniref:Uncharacterized protein n=1 Tax=Anopheles albimanus TaxID=7167 RepID=A0A182F6C3_ANOAL
MHALESTEETAIGGEGEESPRHRSHPAFPTSRERNGIRMSWNGDSETGARIDGQHLHAKDGRTDPRPKSEAGELRNTAERKTISSQSPRPAGQVRWRKKGEKAQPKSYGSEANTFDGRQRYHHRPGSCILAALLSSVLRLSLPRNVHEYGRKMVGHGSKLNLIIRIWLTVITFQHGHSENVEPRALELSTKPDQIIVATNDSAQSTELDLLDPAKLISIS